MWQDSMIYGRESKLCCSCLQVLSTYLQFGFKMVGRAWHGVLQQQNYSDQIAGKGMKHIFWEQNWKRVSNDVVGKETSYFDQALGHSGKNLKMTGTGWEKIFITIYICFTEKLLIICINWICYICIYLNRWDFSTRLCSAKAEGNYSSFVKTKLLISSPLLFKTIFNL